MSSTGKDCDSFDVTNGNVQVEKPGTNSLSFYPSDKIRNVDVLDCSKHLGCSGLFAPLLTSVRDILGRVRVLRVTQNNDEKRSLPTLTRVPIDLIRKQLILVETIYQ